jgi:hypothetical protein
MSSIKPFSICHLTSFIGHFRAVADARSKGTWAVTNDQMKKITNEKREMS